MKSKLTSFYILFFLIYFTGCVSSSNKDVFFDRINKNGIRETGFFSKDSLLTGSHKYYYPNGKLKCDEFYVNGKLNGVRKNYFTNEVLEQLCSYANGLLDGWCYDYNSQGVLEDKVYFLKGKQVGDMYLYSANGKTKQYLLLDFFSKKTRTILYDAIERPYDSIGGSMFVDTVYNSPKIHSDSLYIGILVSHPPKTLTHIRIENYDSSGKLLNTDQLDSRLPYINFIKKIDKRLFMLKIIGDQYDSSINHRKISTSQITFD